MGVSELAPKKQHQWTEGADMKCLRKVNPLNAKLNPICHPLALLEAHHILHVSVVRVKGHILQDHKTNKEIKRNKLHVM